MLHNLFFSPQGIIYGIIVNESLNAFKIIFFGFNVHMRLILLNSDYVKVRKDMLDQSRK